MFLGSTHLRELRGGGFLEIIPRAALGDWLAAKRRLALHLSRSGVASETLCDQR